MPYVIYYRKKQTEGRFVTFPDQKARVAAFLRQHPDEVLGEYIEQERGGRHVPRVELQRAIDHARKVGATLLFARVNRMSRNVAVTDMLLKATEAGNFHFIGCDSPTFNERTIHILAAVAHDHYVKVSERQKTAMAECRARGVKLGSADPNHWRKIEHKRGWKKAVKEAAKARSEKATQHYQYLLPQIVAFREAGESMDNICWWLNQSGHSTTVGKPFTQTSLWRLLQRTSGEKYLRIQTEPGITPLRRQRIIEELVPIVQAASEPPFAPMAEEVLETLHGLTAFLGKGFSSAAVWKIMRPYLQQVTV
jgi:DNA invertase Pin-like site-specific DNA recombinase